MISEQFGWPVIDWTWLRRLLVIAVAGGAAALLTGNAAHAEFKLRYPIIEYREFEFEHNGSVSIDNRSGMNNSQSYPSEIEYGVLPWWKPGLEADWEAAPGQNLKYNVTAVENFFQPFEQGKYWADLGFFVEYDHAASRADADSVTFGPLVQKEWNDAFNSGQNTLHTLNVLVSKQVGRNRNDATPVAVAWQSRLRINPFFEPGIEYYGAFNNIVNRTTMSDPTHRAGPAVAGLVNFYQYGKIKYEAGYLFGLNNATERGTVRWRFEYEKAF